MSFIKKNLQVNSHLTDKSANFNNNELNKSNYAKVNLTGASSITNSNTLNYKRKIISSEDQSHSNSNQNTSKKIQGLNISSNYNASQGGSSIIQSNNFLKNNSIKNIKNAILNGTNYQHMSSLHAQGRNSVSSVNNTLLTNNSYLNSIPTKTYSNIKDYKEINKESEDSFKTRVLLNVKNLKNSNLINYENSQTKEPKNYLDSDYKNEYNDYKKEIGGGSLNFNHKKTQSTYQINDINNKPNFNLKYNEKEKTRNLAGKQQGSFNLFNNTYMNPINSIHNNNNISNNIPNFNVNVSHIRIDLGNNTNFNKRPDSTQKVEILESNKRATSNASKNANYLNTNEPNNLDEKEERVNKIIQSVNKKTTLLQTINSSKIVNINEEMIKYIENFSELKKIFEEVVKQNYDGKMALLLSKLNFGFNDHFHKVVENFNLMRDQVDKKKDIEQSKIFL